MIRIVQDDGVLLLWQARNNLGYWLKKVGNSGKVRYKLYLQDDEHAEAVLIDLLQLAAKVQVQHHQWARSPNSKVWLLVSDERKLDVAQLALHLVVYASRLRESQDHAREEER